jgi:hypothetical protein
VAVVVNFNKDKAKIAIGRTREKQANQMPDSGFQDSQANASTRLMQATIQK